MVTDFFYYNDYIINKLAKNGEFPSKEFIEIVKSDDRKYSYIKYRLRNLYCANVSWALLTEEFIKEVIDVFKKYKLKKIIDVFGGSGSFSYYIKKLNKEFDIVSYTIQNDSYFHHLSKMKENNLNNGLLKVVKSHKEFYNLIDGYDCVIASWIPYDLEDAENLLINMNKDQYILVITEGEGGCIANDKFHQILDSKAFKKIHEFKTLISFDGIHDRAFLYKKVN
jgi:hypothetical protein